MFLGDFSVVEDSLVMSEATTDEELFLGIIEDKTFSKSDYKTSHKESDEIRDHGAVIKDHGVGVNAVVSRSITSSRPSLDCRFYSMQQQPQKSLKSSAPVDVAVQQSERNDNISSQRFGSTGVTSGVTSSGRRKNAWS